jgi:hypothetical protein
MKIRKLLLIVLLGIFLIPAAFSVGFADLTQALPAVLGIQEFLVADLGLTGGGGRDYELFRLVFGPSAVGPDPYKLAIRVESAEGGTLLTGESGKHPYSTFANKTFYNYNLLDRLGGSFDLAGNIPTRIQDAVLNTGAVPQGNFTMTFTLKDNTDITRGEKVITVIVNPMFLLSLAPSDGELVNKQKLNFIWLTNLKNLRLNIFDRPAGGSAIASAGVTGRSFKWPGLVAQAKLEPGENYYWQVAGYKTTTHGDVKITGPRNMFVYYEGKIPENITPLDKAAIKAALEGVGVTGLSNLQLKWVMYDDSVVYITDPITSMLKCLAESDIDYNVRWE